MAVNLIDSNDIKVIQSDNDIELQTDKTTLNSIINAKIKNSNTSSSTDTYSCDYIDSIKDTYSTSETLTNKVWIDGKPIYKKTIKATTLNTANEIHQAHNINNLKAVIKYEGFVDPGANLGECRFLPQFYYNMSSDFALTLYTVTKNDLNIYYGNWVKESAPKDIYITLYYIKTID